MEYSRLKILNSFSKIWLVCVKGLVFIYLIVFIFACSSLRNIEIETSVLPEYPIADDIQSLVLLNRSMNRQFSNIPSDSLEKILIRNKMELDTVFRDSIAADTVIHTAAKALFDSERFDIVIPEAHHIERDDYNDIRTPMNSGNIRKICDEFNVNGVLILERFEEQIATKYYYKPFEPLNAEVYSAATDIKYKSEWRLYRPDEHKPAIRFQINDSIFWKNNNASLNDLYVQMPLTKEALIGGGIASGLKISEYISPTWMKHTRYYFLTGKNEIDYAATLINENKWDEAADLWSKYAKVNSKQVRSKVEFNLALTEEMKGNLDLAIEWGLKSYNTRYTKVAEEYLKNLDATRKAKQNEPKQRF